ncbi:hypothetical protein AT746_18145 [Lacimicrobium alkaliphilum]|uniref:Phytase-like domain-containing protein n=1 Tax=Lacimicrobium alkaliphilum TaxID=1526571 RepID=A0A0U2QQH1_9ALTE|nr:hypothetical protein [Lacimicrobium alkaliphilum]ALS99995.1 hypothetical protein AT746_18145 [Lacimicrobium alkaliphilum]
MNLNRTLLFGLLLFFYASTTLVAAQQLEVKGQWIRHSDGTVMADPQPSGLALWQGKLLSVSDRSAIESQRLRVHPIDPDNARLAEPQWPISLSEQVKDSCFADYVGDNPDLEALVVDPDDHRVFITVTEDASKSVLSDDCARRYAESGSTDFPTVLIRLELQPDRQLLVTGLRPLQFDPGYRVGNFPNDGIEGLAFGPGRTLYMALEKDMAVQPRIFKTTVGERFWQSENFVAVEDAELLLPQFVSGNHPINALEYYAAGEGSGFLLAAARNDDQLWIVDLDKRLPTRMLDLDFMAEAGGECPDWEPIEFTAIEGIAVKDNSLWMVNDPWKVNYPKNIRCQANRQHYQNMSPLLFELPLNPIWFQRP